MLSSLELLQQTGISRATLHNYIALGLLPKPDVRNPGDDPSTRARQIGYFPEEVLERIERIKALKKDGVAMADIARHLSPALKTSDAASVTPTSAPDKDDSKGSDVLTKLPTPRSAPSPAAAETGPLRLTVDKLPCPAYMLNYNLELTWYNEEARTTLLGTFEKLPADTKERGVIGFFSTGVTEQAERISIRSSNCTNRWDVYEHPRRPLILMRPRHPDPTQAFRFQTGRSA